MPGDRKFDVLSSVMDVESTLGRLGDDVELMEEIMLIFLEDAPSLVHAAREAIAKGDMAQLRRAAHSLKGMMATLSARDGANAAFRVEQCAAAGEVAQAPALIHECGEQVAEIWRVLQAYCQQAGAGNQGSAVPSRS